MTELYERLGEAKCEELVKKSWSLWHLFELGEGRKSAQVGGVAREGIARDFIREFLPPRFVLKPGLVFDDEAKKMSPQVDAIIYQGAPLLNLTDVVVVEKNQVRAIFEIKSFVDQQDIFGAKSGGIRNPDTGLVSAFRARKAFLPAEGRYVLFTFELWSSSPDNEVIDRLRQICDLYAVVIRREPSIERKAGKDARVTNFDGSIGKLIEWLRSLT